MSLDLTTEQGIEAYINSSKRFGLASRVKSLEGGSGNFVFRVYLENPLVLDSITHNTIIAKHGRQYVKTMPDFPLPLERQVSPQTPG
jgi:hypothetical protein